MKMKNGEEVDPTGLVDTPAGSGAVSFHPAAISPGVDTSAVIGSRPEFSGVIKRRPKPTSERINRSSIASGHTSF